LAVQVIEAGAFTMLYELLLIKLAPLNVSVTVAPDAVTVEFITGVESVTLLGNISLEI
jgi:hypothetical protein